MSKPDDSDRAFEKVFPSGAAGMSLRDYMAGQALAAKLLPGLIGYEDNEPEHRAELIRRVVRDAYEIADAMLKERARR